MVSALCTLPKCHHHWKCKCANSEANGPISSERQRSGAQLTECRQVGRARNERGGSKWTSQRGLGLFPCEESSGNYLRQNLLARKCRRGTHLLAFPFLDSLYDTPSAATSRDCVATDFIWPPTVNHSLWSIFRIKQATAAAQDCLILIPLLTPQSGKHMYLIVSSQYAWFVPRNK